MPEQTENIEEGKEEEEGPFSVALDEGDLGGVQAVGDGDGLEARGQVGGAKLALQRKLGVGIEITHVGFRGFGFSNMLAENTHTSQGWGHREDTQTGRSGSQCHRPRLHGDVAGLWQGGYD